MKVGIYCRVSTENQKGKDKVSSQSIADVIKDSDTNTLDFLRDKYKSKK